LKKLFFFLLFSIIIPAIYAENAESKNGIPELKHILSLDTGFTMAALQNYGFGIGVNYEQKLTNFLSIKPGLGHMVCFSDITAITVDLKLFANYYPLSNGLDKLYIGFGCITDFIMYSTDKNIPQDIAISVVPLAGWKWRVTSFLMIDPFIGGKFFVMKTDNYKNVDNYLNGGLQWGIIFLLFLKI
jgi:hypothetical protein